MADQGTPSAPPGWYPDPTQPGRLRYWTGVEWGPAPPPPVQPVQQAPQLTAPPGTDWNTPWIWLVIAVPFVVVVFLLFIDWGSMFSGSIRDPLWSVRVLFSPVYIVLVLAGWASYGLSVFFAYRDWRELQRRGVPRPFHWAWAFLYAVVYTFGRSIVVKSRTGRGHAPLWAEVAVLALSVAISIYISVAVVIGALAQFPVSYR